MGIVGAIIEIVGSDKAVGGRHDFAHHGAVAGDAFTKAVIAHQLGTFADKFSKRSIGYVKMGKILIQSHDSKINTMLNSVKPEINNLSLFAIKQNVDNQIVKNNIRNIRKKLGMTQGDLGSLANCSTQQIQLLESGQRGLDLKWMAVLADSFNKHLGSNKYKPWHLIMSEEEFDAIIQSEEEAILLRHRRALEETEQKIFDAMSESNIKTIKEIKKSN